MTQQIFGCTAQPFKKRKFICFIPNYRIFRQSIIRNIPTDIDLAELKSGIVSPVEVIELRRLNQRITTKNDSGNTTTEFIPAKLIVLNFLNQVLPKYVYIFLVRCDVTPFIPKTTICLNCFKFGHASSNCRGKPCCKHCGRSDHDSLDSCPHKDLPSICANCKGEHSPLDPKCPELQIQKNVQLLASENNIPLKEAREILTGKKQTSNSRYDIFEFPSLSNSSCRFSSTASPPTSLSPLFSHNYAHPISHSSPINIQQKSYASAVTSSSSTSNKIKLINKPLYRESFVSPNNFSPPSRPSNTMTPPDHDYFIEPNGRSSIKPPNGCAISSQNHRFNYSHLPSRVFSPPSGSSEYHLQNIFQLFVQFFAAFSQFNFEPSVFNSNFSHPSPPNIAIEAPTISQSKESIYDQANQS